MHVGHLRRLGIGRVGIVDDEHEALASSGTPENASGGDTSSPSQVYFLGISPPSANAGEMIFRAMAPI